MSRTGIINKTKVNFATNQPTSDAAAIQIAGDIWDETVGDGILSVIEIDDGDSPYSVPSGVSVIICDTSSGDVTVNLPSLSSSFGRRIKIINESGANDVIVNPGTDKINNYTSDFIINVDQGYLDVIGSTNQWNGETDGWSSIVYIATESVDSLTTTFNTWGDVNLGSSGIIPTAGTWIIDSFVVHYIAYTLLYAQIYSYFGIGETSGNNAPDLIDKFVSAIELNTNIITGHYFPHHINNEKIEITTDNKQIYMKLKYSANKAAATSNFAYGTTNSPMYIQARRKF